MYTPIPTGSKRNRPRQTHTHTRPRPGWRGARRLERHQSVQKEASAVRGVQKGEGAAASVKTAAATEARRLRPGCGQAGARRLERHRQSPNSLGWRGARRLCHVTPLVAKPALLAMSSHALSNCYLLAIHLLSSCYPICYPICYPEALCGTAVS